MRTGPESTTAVELPGYAPDETAAIRRVLEHSGYAACIYCEARLAVREIDGLLVLTCPIGGRTGTCLSPP